MENYQPYRRLYRKYNKYQIRWSEFENYSQTKELKKETYMNILLVKHFGKLYTYTCRTYWKTVEGSYHFLCEYFALFSRRFNILGCFSFRILPKFE